MTDSPAITEAFDNFTNLKLAVGKASAGLYTTAKLLYEAKLNKYYKDMGCETLQEYAAQSEIGLSSSTASMLITLYGKFVIEADDHEILDVQIMFKDYSKAYKAIPLLANNKPHEVIEIIQDNSTADIITRVKELNGEPEGYTGGYVAKPVAVEHHSDGSVTVCKEIADEIWGDTKHTPLKIREYFKPS